MVEAAKVADLEAAGWEALMVAEEMEVAMAAEGWDGGKAVAEMEVVRTAVGSVAAMEAGTEVEVEEVVMGEVLQVAAKEVAMVVG